jgi:hypothetical protein
MNECRSRPRVRSRRLVFGCAGAAMIFAGCLTPALLRLGILTPGNAGKGPGEPIIVDAPAAPAAQPGVEPPPRPSVPGVHVLLIAVDGLRPDAIDGQRTPNLARLIERGAYAPARNILPCCTLPNHAAMITGLDAAGHGLTENWYLGARRIGVPTLLDAARDAGMTTALYYGKLKFAVFERPGALDRVARCWDGCEIVRQFARDLPERKWNLAWVCIPDADFAGHYYGWMSPRYLQAVQMIDGMIGLMLASVEQAGLAGKVHILLTADHGGSRYDHWIDTPVNRTIPFLIAGPSVKPGYRLDADGRRPCVTDFAPTAAHLLGVALPREPVGAARTDALTEPRVSAGFGFAPTVPTDLPARSPLFDDPPAFDEDSPDEDPEFPERREPADVPILP